MNCTAASLSPLKPSARVACTVFAAVFATVANLGLLGLFNRASSERWLSPTPLLLQAKAQCDARPGREARTRCTQDLVTQTLAAVERGQMYAQR